MRIVELVALYSVIGLVVAGMWASPAPRQRWLDGALLVPLWPVYAPLLPWSERTLARPSRALAAGPKNLEARLGRARDRLARIDAMLRQPEFSPTRAEQRCSALDSDGANATALGAARARLANIRRLVEFRERLARELAALEELRAQLKVQTALLSLSGEGGDLDALFADLTARAEGLDLLLADDGSDGLG